ncbi:MAG: hypothetical protein DLM52_00255, partial [Chthoniobacterales bacterium]
RSALREDRRFAGAESDSFELELLTVGRRSLAVVCCWLASPQALHFRILLVQRHLFSFFA